MLDPPDPLLARIDEAIAERMAMLGGDDDQEALRLEGSFIDFVESAWPSIDPAIFQSNWAITGLAEHLEAVAAGQIKRLIVNFPPRSSKTILSSVCFPAWIWAQRQRTMLTGSQVKFICGSYGHSLSLMNFNLCRRLIVSPWYRGLWGHRWTLRDDQNTKLHFDTSTGGQRIAVSVGSALLGIGGDNVVVEDPLNVRGVVRAAEGETVWLWLSELSSTRLNSPRDGAVIVVMQRLSGADITGRLLDCDGGNEYVPYMVPLEFEAARCCQTGWQTDQGFVTWTDEASRLRSGRIWPRVGCNKARSRRAARSSKLTGGRCGIR